MNENVGAARNPVYINRLDQLPTTLIPGLFLCEGVNPMRITIMLQSEGWF